MDSSFLAALLDLPKLYGALVSPDGRWVAWSWFGVATTADVYLAPTDGSAPPVRLTATDENAMLASWTPDSTGVIVGQDHDGDERTQLFRVDIEHPEALRPLTEPHPPYFLQGGALHPDGRRLFYGMNYDAEAGCEIEPTWLYRHDLETGERVAIARPERAGWLELELNDDGTAVLYHRMEGQRGGMSVWLVGVDGSGDGEIVNAGPDRKATGRWFPDGRRVLVLAETATHRRVGVWEDGATRWLLDDPARNIEEVSAPRGTDGNTVVLVEGREARMRASLLDVTTGREAPFPEVPGNLQPLRPLADGSWVAAYYSATQPLDLIRWRPGESPAAAPSLTRVWERVAFRPEDLVVAEEFRWTSVDGLEIQGWLYRPPGEPVGTILAIHGGPTAHSEDALNAAVQYYVSRGFNVLAPNYRGSTGFGLPFQESIKEDGWGGREQEDIARGAQALIDAGIAQPGRIGITGTSYGGYSSWCAITRQPASLIAASAPICGMTDLVVDYETTRPDLRPYSEEMMGGSPAQVPERYRRASPINAVDRIEGSLLIVQGARDPNVTPENVRAVRAALDRAGIPYEVEVFENEGHGISRKENQRTLYPRIASFFLTSFDGARPG